MIDSQDLCTHEDFLRRAAQRMTRQPQEADDLVQETLLYALRRPPERTIFPRAWLRRVMRSIASNRHLREDHRSSVEGRAARPEELPSGEAALMDREEVLDAVRRLPPGLREVVEPYYFDGLDVREIAHRDNLTQAAVKTRLKRARSRMRDHLERHGDRLYGLLPLGLFRGSRRRLPLLAGVGGGLVLVSSVLLLSLDATDSRARGPEIGRLGETVRPVDRDTSLSDAGGALLSLPERSVPTAAGSQDPRSSAAVAPKRVSFRVVDTRRQPVVGIEVGYVNEEDPSGLLQHASPVRGQTDAQGRGQLDLIEGAVSLRVLDPDWTTLFTGSVEVGSGSGEALLIAEPAAPVTGTVRNSKGLPVSKAHVRLEWGPKLKSLHTRLGGSQFAGWSTHVREDGSYVLPGTAEPGLLLVRATSAVERASSEAEEAKSGQVLVLGEPSCETCLRGLVLDGEGLPVVDAKVSCQGHVMTTDQDGRFYVYLWRAGIHSRYVQSMFGNDSRVVWALREGYQPASLVSGRADLQREDDLVLVLDTPALSQQGRVLDEEGRALAGAEVWLADPSYFGTSKGLPVGVERLARGESLWQPTRTDSEGRFELRGLRSRTYRLMVRRSATGTPWRSDSFEPSDDALTLRLPAPGTPRLLRGRVRTLGGEGIEGASVIPVFVDRTYVDAAGRSIRESSSQGAAVLAGPEGAFEVSVAPGERLRIRAEGFVATETTAGGEEPLLFTLERWHAFELPKIQPPAATLYRILDAEGKVLPGYPRTHLPRDRPSRLWSSLATGQGHAEQTRTQAMKGSGLGYSERARTIVFMEHDREVSRAPLALGADGILRVERIDLEPDAPTTLGTE